MGPAEQAAHQLSQSISRRMSGPIQDSMDMLADAEFVAVVCHIHPDADAIGAASAMVMALRQRGIRPYRVIGDDPWNWRPWAISAGYLVLSAALVVVGVIALSQARQLRELQMLETEEADYWGKGR